MCWSGASSRIATQYVRWGYQDHRQYLGVDWTKDPVVWNRFLNELLDIPKLKNIHFMGGETLLTSRFEEFVDFMIAHERFDICLSFVTNGTTFNESLINKLKRFARVGLELSIETVTEHNTYVRQGTDTKLVLANIQKYQQYCNRSSITLTIRPAISALTVGYYHTLLNYCLEHQLIIKSLLVTTPAYLDIKVLPESVKSQYKDRYQKILEQVSEVDINVDYNESDPNNYRQSIKVQVLQVLDMLNQPSDQNLLKELVEICRRWDNEFGYDAIELYPELAEVFVQYGY
jgi:sulfatase maturation enzyme AslB (radical SAM superfamily)